MKTLLILLLLSSSCFAQFEMTVTKQPMIDGLKNPVVIGGRVFYDSGTPKISEAGKIVLDTKLPLKDIIVEAENLDTEEFVELTKPEPDGYVWTINTPGRFRVTADGWSPEGRYRKRSNITLGGSPPDGPGTSPSPAFKELGKKLTNALADPPTTKALKDGIAYMAKTFTDDVPLEKAKKDMVTAIESILLLRQGSSRTKDWLNGFRIPVQNALLGIKTTKEYREAMLSLTEGM